MTIIKINLIAVLSMMLLVSSCKKKEATPEPTPDPVVVVPVVPSINSSQVTITGSHFTTLFDHQSVTFSNKLWIIGGRTGNVSRNEIWSSTDGVSWSQTGASIGFIFSARSAHSVVVFNNKLWVIGGVNAGAGLNDVWSSMDGINWVQETASAQFTPRYNHEVVVFNNKMWLIAGDAGVVKDEIWSSTDGITWTKETVVGTQFSARAGHEVVVFNNKLFVIGGYSTTGFKNDVWSSGDGINWVEETTTGSKFLPMYGHEALVYNNMIYVIAGQTGAWGTTTDEVWASSNGKDWTKQTINGTSYGGRACHQASVFNSKIYVTGGYDSASQEKNDVWTLN